MTFKTELVTNPDARAIHRAGEILRQGGLVAFPTETVYGLGGNAFDPEATKKIYAAKGRPSDNPLIVHLETPQDAETIAYTTPMFWRLAARFMPGPLTVILKKRENIPDTVTGGLDSVAIRVPSHPIARALIAESGVPIAAPSANVSGKPSPTLAMHVYHDLNTRIEMILDGGPCEIGLESTIVKLDGEHITLLRPGGITLEDLTACCGKIDVDPAVLERFDGIPQAPGMKYRHYAPHMPVKLLIGTDAKFFSFLENQTEPFGVLCYTEDLPYLRGVPTAVLGEASDFAAHARHLFAALREMDAYSHIRVVYARAPKTEHLGLAVYNRLAKAAGFAFVEL